MGDAYEVLGPADENVPDAPPPPPMPEPEPEPAPAPAAPAAGEAAVPGKSQPPVAPLGGLPLRDDDLDFASKQQTLEAPSKKTKTITKKKTLNQEKTKQDKKATHKSKMSKKKDDDKEDCVDEKKKKVSKSVIVVLYTLLVIAIAGCIVGLALIITGLVLGLK